MADFNFGIQAAKDVQVQYQNDRSRGMMSQNAQTQSDGVKNVSGTKPKGSIKQIKGSDGSRHTERKAAR